MKKSGSVRLFFGLLRQADVGLSIAHACVHLQDRQADSGRAMQQSGIGGATATHEFRRIDLPVGRATSPDRRLFKVRPEIVPEAHAISVISAPTAGNPQNALQGDRPMSDVAFAEDAAPSRTCRSI